VKFEMTSKHPISLAWTLRVAVVLMLTATGPVLGQGTKPGDAGVALPAVEKDVPYADGGDERKLDLYLPEKAGFATVVFTYGGGWHSGSRKSFTPVGEKFRSLGFGCALLSHRLSPKDKFPAQIEDIAAAFAWVKRHIAEKGGDPKRVYVMGHSSGAHLSLLLATDPKYLARHRLTPRAIAGVIGLSSPVDLEPRKDGKGFGDALLAGHGADAFSRDVEAMRGASPIRHISEGLPPVLLIVGERDFPMLKGDAAAFVDKAKALKLSAAYLVAEGCDHMGVIRSFVDEHSKVCDDIILFINRSGRLEKERTRPFPCGTRGRQAAWWVRWCSLDAERLARNRTGIVCASVIPECRVFVDRPIRRVVPGPIERREFECIREPRRAPSSDRGSPGGFDFFSRRPPGRRMIPERSRAGPPSFWAPHRLWRPARAWRPTGRGDASWGQARLSWR